MSAVTPASVAVFTSRPGVASSAQTVSVWPPTAARMSAVQPSPVAAFTSRPGAASSALTVRAWPSSAASMSAVVPKPSAAFTSRLGAASSAVTASMRSQQCRDRLGVAITRRTHECRVASTICRVHVGARTSQQRRHCVGVASSRRVHELRATSLTLVFAVVHPLSAVLERSTPTPTEKGSNVSVSLPLRKD
eukprot:scaffold28607_cov64-Phaeocystis_antarctica.AAC.3